MKSIVEYINETRLGLGANKHVYGRTLNGKECDYVSDNGKTKYHVTDIHFDGDSFIGKVNGKEKRFHIQCGFAQHLDGSTVPMHGMNDVLVDVVGSKEEGILTFKKEDIIREKLGGPDFYDWLDMYGDKIKKNTRNLLAANASKDGSATQISVINKCVRELKEILPPLIDVTSYVEDVNYQHAKSKEEQEKVTEKIYKWLRDGYYTVKL